MYFDICRKNHQRAMESMQASLESEQRAKAEALRIKKKLEGDINELEIALDHSNKANSEAQKSIKRYQVRQVTVFFTSYIVFFKVTTTQALPNSNNYQIPLQYASLSSYSQTFLFDG
jgi:hypothetical protein